MNIQCLKVRIVTMCKKLAMVITAIGELSVKKFCNAWNQPHITYLWLHYYVLTCAFQENATEYEHIESVKQLPLNWQQKCCACTRFSHTTWAILFLCNSGLLQVKLLDTQL